jgi:NTP pyrophosphatase (non-canonical NTP hydrolase)
MLKEAQEAVKKVSYEAHKKEVSTSSFFITLLAEQVGQIAEKYITEGRRGRDIEVDIADVIVVSLAYLNWLEKDASEAFRKSLEKHEKAIKHLVEQRKK